MNPILTKILEFIGIYIVSVGLLFGVQSALAALITAWLRRQQPTLQKRRAYLLRDSEHLLPRQNEEQRLERIRQSRWLVGGLTLGFPPLFLSKVLSRWSGLMSFDVIAWRIEIMGLCMCVPLVLFAAYAVARARLAGDLLQRPHSSNPETFPA